MEQQTHKFPKNLWFSLHEPRYVTAIMIVGYAIIGVMGAVSFAYPPSSIESELGPLLTRGASLAMTFGGVVGLSAAPRGVRWVERPAIYAVMAGFLMYGSTVINLQFTEPGYRFMQIGVIAWGLLGALVRLYRIWGSAYDPSVTN